jgi:hypothetical protein
VTNFVAVAPVAAFTVRFVADLRAVTDSDLGLGGVTLISMDDEWSAMRTKRVERPPRRT